MTSPAKHLNLPWNQEMAYWLCVMPVEGQAPNAVAQSLSQIGMQERSGARQRFVISAPREWAGQWHRIQNALVQANYFGNAEFSIVPGEAEPDESHVLLNVFSTAQASGIAESLWLGNALLNDQVRCYLQPVISSSGKVFGYESFARVVLGSGEVIGGAAIVKAARSLSIEYAIDRQLQVQAIKTFVSSHFDGFLFVNFFPGFIQRPDVYLEGLSETVRAYGIVPKHVVLDFTKSETPRDITHMKRVTEYCRTKGYAMALDDVESVANVRNLIHDIRPDYVKLDMKLVAQVTNNMSAAQTVRDIVELCQGIGAMVVAEGVETEAVYNALKALNVDLFQGYYFSPPVPVEVVEQQGKGVA